MKLSSKIAITALFTVVAGFFQSGKANAQCNIITTIAGNGSYAYSGDGGAATSASMELPFDAKLDAAGNVYIADYGNNRVRKVSTSGIITTVAGNGTAGFTGDGGQATAAELHSPAGLAFDASGNMYIADALNYRIRKVTTSGVISTICGTGSSSFSGDGGPATAAALGTSRAIVFDASGNLILADEGSQRVRKINTSGVINTIAGNGTSGFSGDGGAATSAELFGPVGVAVDASGNIYISEYNNNRIRKVNTSGIISTYAGNGTAGYSGDGGAATAAELNEPYKIATDAAGNVYVADYYNNMIREISTSGVINRIVGTGTSTFSGDGGAASSACISYPTSVTVDGSGNIYICDYDNERIRKVTTGVPTVAAISGSTTVAAGSTITLTDATSGGTWSSSSSSIATVSSSGSVGGAAAGSATISYSLTNSCGTAVVTYGITVFGSSSPSLSCYIITTVSGNGTDGNTGDGGAATAAKVDEPAAVRMDRAGNLYFASGQEIRKITPAGVISTIAGVGSNGYYGDGGAATAAELNYPFGIAIDRSGNIYIADNQNQRVRKVSTSGIISTFAGNGSAGYSGDGGAATGAKLYYPSGVAVDTLGNVYIADMSNYRIRKVSSSGVISTVAGNGTGGYTGDGGAATAAELSGPENVILDTMGNMYIVDGNSIIRKVTASGIISTIAGNGTAGYSGDGGAATAAEFNQMKDMAIDRSGNIYIADEGNQRIRMINTSGVVSTMGGSGNEGFGGENSDASTAELNFPWGITTDTAGDVYFADNYNNRIRKLTPSNSADVAAITGSVGVAAGSVLTLSDSTTGGAWVSTNTFVATVNSSGAITGIEAGTTTISYTVAGRCGTTVIKPITVTGATSSACYTITTVAGDATTGYSGDGGAATSAELSEQFGITIDGSGNMYVADAYNNRIRKITASGIITTIAGNGTSGFSGDGGAATAAELATPDGVAVDGSGNVYIADTYNNRIRKVSTSGVVSTIAGSYAGYSGDGRAATAALLTDPVGITVDAYGNIYFGDVDNNVVRMIDTTGIIRTIAGGGYGTGHSTGDGGMATGAQLFGPDGIAVDHAGNIYIADVGFSGIRKIDTSGFITTIAGNGTSGYSGDGGPASAALLNKPTAVVVDAAGNLYIADQYNNRVRKINTSGIITTIAGNGTASFSGDGGAATAAEMYYPCGLALDGAGNLLVSDNRNSRVRKLQISSSTTVAAISGGTTIATGGTLTLTDSTTGGTWSSSNTTVATVSGGVVGGAAAGSAIITYSATGSCGTASATAVVTVGATTTGSCNIITTIAGNGTSGFSGDGGAATAAELYGPYGVAIDGGGNVYVADAGNYRVRKVTPSGVVSTFAGTGTAGSTGDGGAATAAELYTPFGLIFDGSGNLYISDAHSQTVRKVTPAGLISTIAGNGSTGSSGDGGQATAAELNGPAGLAFDVSGNLYIADQYENRVRKVSPAGIITTAAGQGTAGFSGDGSAATGAELHTPEGVAVDRSGNLYIADNLNYRVRMVSPSGVIKTIAGNGADGFAGDGGAATAASLSNPTGLALDGSGNLYIADYNNHRIRMVDPSGNMSTFAGGGGASYGGDGGPASAASLNGPVCVTLDGSGSLYIGDYGENRIRKITAGSPTVTAISGPTTVAAGATITLTDATSGGTWSSSSTSIATVGSTGTVGGVAAGSATISYSVTNSCGTAVVTYSVTVTGTTACSIITTVAGDGTSGFSGDGGAATTSMLNNPTGVAVDASGNVYIVDIANNRIRKVSSSGVISTIAGNGTASYSGDGGAATAATLNNPVGIAIDGSGNVYIADYFNNVIRRITPSGIISTVAGNGTAGYSGDGGAATAAKFNRPWGIAVDGSGNMYIGDYNNHRVRKVNPSGIIGTIAGNGTLGYSGDGGAATAAELNYPAGVAFDGSGNVYIADASNNRVRTVTPSGIISTIAGNGTSGYSGDGGAATAAELQLPLGVAIDGSGALLIADSYNNRIRKVSLSGTISTLAGDSTGGYGGDGGAATAAGLHSAYGVAVDGSGNVYIADYGNNRVRKVSTGSGSSVAAISGATTVVVGSTITLTDATSGGTWSSSSSSIASISSSGTVGGVAAGSVTISYSVTNSCGTTVVTYSVTVTGTTACSIITTVAGDGTRDFGGDGGPATAAYLYQPGGSTMDRAGNLYIADYGNNRIRKVNTSGVISTFAGNGTNSYAGDGGQATAAEIWSPLDVYADASGNVYICDAANQVVRKVNSSGIISTFAGKNISGFTGDGGQATAAEIAFPTGITGDRAGNIYIADHFNYCIRKVTPSGIISTVAGNHSAGYSGDGGAATSASMYVYGVAIDTFGNLYVTDEYNNRVRKINTSGIISTIAGTGSYTNSGDGGAATAAGVYSPEGIAVDNAGNIYIATSNVLVRKINASGIITTYAGDGTAGSSGDGGSPTAAELTNPYGVFLDSVGNLYITDYGANVIRKVSPGGGSTYVAAVTGSSTVCVSGSITLTDSTSGGTWTTSAAGIASVNSTGTVTGLSTGTATLTYSVTGSCGSAYVTKSITVLSSAVSSVSGPSTVCTGATITLTDSTGGGTWSTSNEAIASVNSSGVVRGVSGGTVNITYSVSGTCGTGTSVKTITVNAAPSTPSGISGSASVCVGATTSLSDGTSGGSWTTSAASVASVNSSGLVSGVSVGAATITYTVTNSCGSAYSILGVTVASPASVGTVSGASSVCVGNTTTLTDGASGGTWSSSNAAIATVGAASGVVTGISAGSVTISYSVTNTCGTVSATKTLTVNAAATAGSITGASILCVAASSTFTDGVSGGSWSSSAGSIATVNSSGMVTGVSPGTATISYTVSTSCGSVSAIQSITISNAPSAGTITGPTSMCIGSVITLTDATTGGTWTSANSSIASVNASGHVTGLSVGTTAISYTVTTGCGTGTTAAVVSVGSLPSAGTITGPTSVCTGATVSLGDATTGGSWVSSNTAIATVVSSTGVVSGVTAGSVTISYYVSSSCATAITTSTITVTASSSGGTISGLATVCPGASITLTTTGTAGGAWSSSNTARASVSSSGVVHGISAGAVTISYSAASGCGSSVAIKSITVSAVPTVSAITGAAAICTGTTATMTDATSGGGWISSNTGIATINSSGLVSAVAAGAATITYFVTNSCGTATTTKAITVSTLSGGVISGASTVVVGALTTLTASISGGTWSSSNTSLATISATGAVTGVSAGSDTILYAITNVCGTATVRKAMAVTAHRDEMPGGSVSQETGNGDIQIYPNPNTGTFTLTVPENTGSTIVVISDLNGRQLQTRTSAEPTMKFDLGSYAAGVYVVTVNADGKVYNRKVIVN